MVTEFNGQVSAESKDDDDHEELKPRVPEIRMQRAELMTLENWSDVDASSLGHRRSMDQLNAIRMTDSLAHISAVRQFNRGGSTLKYSGLPPLPLPSTSLFHPSSPLSLPLEVGPLNSARGSGECCKLPSGLWSGAPAEIIFFCILALKPDIWWHQIYEFF